MRRMQTPEERRKSEELREVAMVVACYVALMATCIVAYAVVRWSVAWVVAVLARMWCA